MTKGPRIHNRMGGLEAKDILGEDVLDNQIIQFYERKFHHIFEINIHPR